jgi:hypothetical protein
MAMKTQVNMFFQELITAIETSLYVGFGVSGFLYGWTWLTTFQSFRDDLRRAQLGRFVTKAEIAKLAVADCSKYAGLQVAEAHRKYRGIVEVPVALTCGSFRLPTRSWPISSFS